MISSQSRHSARTVRTKRSANAFAFGARRLDDLDSFAGEDGVEVTGELAVAVADEETKGRSPLLECPGELPGLPGDPGAGRVRCNPDEAYASAGKLNEKEHVQPLQRDRVDREEVDGEHGRGLRS